MAAIAALAGGAIRTAEAQQGQPATITVAAVTNAQPVSQLPFAIQVGPEKSVAKGSFIRVRGLPPTVALTEGHAIAPGAWAVPLVALPTLKLILPVGAEGASEVSIRLISAEGAVLAEAKTTLMIAPANPKPRSIEAGPSVSLGLSPPKLNPKDQERALALHAKGVEQLGRGNVYGARKFFERAAEVGLAQAAIAVAGTYDPIELARLRVIGLEPDVEAARKWYAKARELGAAEAEERMRRLPSR